MAKKYFSIREAIRLAESGMTRQELIEYFGLTESEYKKKFASFSEANRKRLKCLLIAASGKKKKKPIEKPVILEVNKNKEEVMEVWDTSYILHIANLEGDMSNVVILPEVYQQLAYHERRGNGKNDKIRMYEKSKITMYKHTFFFVYFFRRYTKNGKTNYTIKDIERNEFKTKLFSFS